MALGDLLRLSELIQRTLAEEVIATGPSSTCSPQCAVHSWQPELGRPRVVAVVLSSKPPQLVAAADPLPSSA